MKSRPTANPTNRFHDTAVTYEDGEGPPPATVKLIEDHSRSILASNDSPDVGFNYSVNPYRGCLHACAYCMSARHADPARRWPHSSPRRSAPGRFDLRHADGRTARGATSTRACCITGRRASRRFGSCSLMAPSSSRAAIIGFSATRLGVRAARRAAVPTTDACKLARLARRPRRDRDARPPRRYVAELSLSARQYTTARRSRRATAYRVAERTRARPWHIDGREVEAPPGLQIVRIEPLGVRDLFDITTGTDDFIANGVVSHNCYARPSHEYLDLGAGTDFDTKIVVKPRRAGAAARSVRQAALARRARDVLAASPIAISRSSRELAADEAMPRGVPRVSQSGRDHHEAAR